MSVSTRGGAEKPTGHRVGHDPDVHLYHDAVAPEAIGGNAESLPKNYYMSFKFIGTLAATCLVQTCGYVGWVLPANTLSLIRAELGVNANTTWLAVAWQIGLTVGFLWVGMLLDIVRTDAHIRTRANGSSSVVDGSSHLRASLDSLAILSQQNIHMILAANCLNGLAAGLQLSFSASWESWCP
jgi:hypothetical protein